ncbi:MAG: hypothetical protein U0S49_01580 [Rhodospirillales bacterium]|nr:hypothetical protein [Rhodospirillales bacterium]
MNARHFRADEPEATRRALVRAEHGVAVPRRRPGVVLGVLLGLAAAGALVAAWQAEARIAGPVRRRTAERLARKPR